MVELRLVVIFECRNSRKVSQVDGLQIERYGASALIAESPFTGHVGSGADQTQAPKASHPALMFPVRAKDFVIGSADCLLYLGRSVNRIAERRMIADART